MAIDNELSGEIATALLTGKHRERHELRDLKETILKVHTTLQRLSAESRKSRIAMQADREVKKADIPGR